MVGVAEGVGVFVDVGVSEAVAVGGNEVGPNGVSEAVGTNPTVQGIRQERSKRVTTQGSVNTTSTTRLTTRIRRSVTGESETRRQRRLFLGRDFFLGLTSASGFSRDISGILAWAGKQVNHARGIG